VALVVEDQLDAVVEEALAVHALPHAGGVEQVRRPLLEDPGALALLDVLARLALEDHGLDALELEQPAEHEAGGPCSHDPDLGARGHGPDDAPNST
jgi:hypothetical protein